MLSLIKDPILEFKSEQVLNLMKTTTLDMSAFDKVSFCI